ncbi:MAG: GNAT family N-acetyltransferase [Phycisphaeraceae bacterium]|nr:GNAT family N-acetyltransferase [Phycisphaeraceae bacterium]
MSATGSKSGGAGIGFALREDLRAHDEAAIRRIADATAFFRPDEVDVACELVRERLDRGPASGYEFVLADDAPAPPGQPPARLLAYACFGPIACTVGSYDLYWIIVDPAYQGRGLGRLLIDAVEQRVRAAAGRKVYIETSSLPRYTPTQRFYERCGYILEARLPDFYQPGDDKLVYAKTVGPASPGQ